MRHRLWLLLALCCVLVLIVAGCYLASARVTGPSVVRAQPAQEVWQEPVRPPAPEVKVQPEVAPKPPAGRPLVLVAEAITQPPERAPEQAPPAAVVQDVYYSPYDGVAFAAQDLAQLVAQGVNVSTIRYLFHGHIPRQHRYEYWQGVSYTLNKLSPYNPNLVRPVLVDGTDQSLVRLDLYHYDIKPEVWNRLAEQGGGRTPEPDPYFQQQVVAFDHLPTPPAPGPPVKDKKDKKDKKDQDKPADKNQFRPASWLSHPTKEKTRGEQLTSLVTTLHTSHPVLRSDWFVCYALWGARYYEFLGLNPKGKIADFEKLIRFRADSKRLAGVVVASNQKSQVALNNRFITYAPTDNNLLTGWYYETHDTRRSIRDRDYLNTILDFLKSDKGRFDATENIGRIPNGLQAYALGNGQGELLEKADADIAQDSLCRYQDKQVWNARNCITCHTQGLKSFRENVRSLSRGRISLLVVDNDDKKTNTRLVSDFFGFDLSVVVTTHQKAYNDAVMVATAGRSASQTAALMENIFFDYLDAGLTLEQGAREVGMPTAQFRRALERGIGIDHPLTGWLQDPPEEARRDQWEIGFGPLMTYLETYRDN